MGSCVGDTAAETEKTFVYYLNKQADLYNITLPQGSAAMCFTDLILKLYDLNGPVVILVDEYDKPILGHLGKDTASDIQQLLKAFYGVIKTTEAKQRFTFITGISKFSKVSIFSDLNNLTDLTMQKRVATLLGYTQEELENNFGDFITALAEEQNTDRLACLEKLKLWYNGYRFHPKERSVYNPVSVMKCFDEREFKNHWFETATPTFLIDILKQKPLALQDFSAPEVSFAAWEPTHLEPLPLLFQTGYLTILSSELLGDEQWFTLGYPNKEVERSFNHFLATGLAELNDSDMHACIRGLLQAIDQTDIEALFKHLKVFLKTSPTTFSSAMKNTTNLSSSLFSNSSELTSKPKSKPAMEESTPPSKPPPTRSSLNSNSTIQLRWL